MQLAIHFCSITFESILILNPLNTWQNADDRVIFVVRAEQPLQNAVIQLAAEDNTVWSSPLRTVPADAVHHPYTSADDQSIIYVSSHFVTKKELLTETPDYTVRVIDASDETILSELPFTIDFLQQEEEETEPDLNAIANILNDTSLNETQTETTFHSNSSGENLPDATITAAQNDAGTVSIEEDAESTPEVDNTEAASSEADTVEQAIASEDADTHTESAAVAEEGAELKAGTFTNELTYDVSLISGVLTAGGPQGDFVIEHSSAAESVVGHYQIVIEKIENQYIAVINDPAARPMFFLENGHFIKEWDQDFSSYIAWLKEQLSLMFNISLDESNKWDILLISENEPEVEVERVVVVNRGNVLLALKNFAAVLDVTENGTLLTLNFVDGTQLNFKFHQLTAVENVQVILPQLADVIAQTAILPTGKLAEPAVLDGLPEQFKNTSNYRRTSLAWEYVMR